jgi:hypothetical protein
MAVTPGQQPDSRDPYLIDKNHTELLHYWRFGWGSWKVVVTLSTDQPQGNFTATLRRQRLGALLHKVRAENFQGQQHVDAKHRARRRHARPALRQTRHFEVPLQPVLGCVGVAPPFGQSKPLAPGRRKPRRQFALLFEMRRHTFDGGL